MHGVRFQPDPVISREGSRASPDSVRPTCSSARQNGNVAGMASHSSETERGRHLSHALALGVVAIAAVTRYAFGIAADPAESFWLFHAAVAVSALRGGWSPAVVAMLASLLVARIGSGITFLSAGLFCVEGLLVSAVVVWSRDALRRQRQRMTVAETRIRELEAVAQRGQVVDAAYTCLQKSSADTAIALLDDRGRIAEWGAGLTRMYGCGADEVPGPNAAALFSPPLADDELARLLAEARHDVVRHQGRHRRADGTPFDVDVEITGLKPGGFAMVVHDCSRQRAWEAFAKSAAETETELREEADVAHRQLAALQHVTDPSLDALRGSAVVTTLLDRLRPLVAADGIVLVHAGPDGPHVFCASDGVQPHERAARPGAEARGQQVGQTLLIHNDAARVSDMSAAAWPDGVASLIAVPVMRAGAVQGVIEVVNTRGRRSTEWEIALIQVVAARIAGLVSDESYGDENPLSSFRIPPGRLFVTKNEEHEGFFKESS
jgi:PAS domain S-box-containing protein